MKDAVDNMAPGSVIVDLAGATGGNCELTKPGETYVYDNRVTIIGTTDLISRMSWQASSMYSNNMANLMDLLCPKPADKDAQKQFLVDMEDPVIRGMTGVFNKEITFPPPESVGKTSAGKKDDEPIEDTLPKLPPKPSVFSKRVWDLVSLGELCLMLFFFAFMAVCAVFAPVSFIVQLLYFILAGFLGYYLIWAVGKYCTFQDSLFHHDLMIIVWSPFDSPRTLLLYISILCILILSQNLRCSVPS
jgi:NAD(P) transhydrogenase subunit alpha